MRPVKPRLFTTDEEKQGIDFGQFMVIEESNNFYGIFKSHDCKRTHPLTHRGTWRSATKIAQLLQMAYETGYAEARQIYSDYE